MSLFDADALHDEAPPELRPDLAHWHCLRCDCQRYRGAVACGSCPFVTAAPGVRRPSNKQLGIGPDGPHRLGEVPA